MDPSLSAVGVTDTMVSASCHVIYFTHKYWDPLSLEGRSYSVQKFWAARILGRSVNCLVTFLLTAQVFTSPLHFGLYFI